MVKKVRQTAEVAEGCNSQVVCQQTSAGLKVQVVIEKREQSDQNSAITLCRQSSELKLQVGIENLAHQTRAVHWYVINILVNICQKTPQVEDLTTPLPHRDYL